METFHRTAWLVTLALAACSERPLYLPDGEGRDMATPDSSRPDFAGPDLSGPLEPVRLISPLSTSTVTTRRPTLRWVERGRPALTEVELCRDRACASRLGHATVDGNRARPDEELPVGPVFWRVHVGDQPRLTSATWQFWVGAGSAATDTSFGTTLDVDGDGHADLAVGQKGDGVAGWVHVFRGGANGFSTTPVVTLPVDDQARFPETFIHSASNVASAGDLDGDGFGDLVVGSQSTQSPGVLARGAVHIYRGGPDGAQPSRVIELSPPAADERFGRNVHSAGDVDGDGYCDLLVIAGQESPPPIYLFLGGPDGVQSDRVRRVTGPYFYADTPGGCDFNGDGYSDLLFGEYEAGAKHYTGQALVYFGGPGGPGAPTIIPAPPDPKGWSFGYTSALTDFNGDGRCDAVIAQNGGPFFVFFGRPDGISTAPDQVLDFGPTDYASVVNAGDVDGDGRADLIVRMDHPDGPLRLLFGGRLALRELNNDEFVTARGAGDLDGDGLGDFAIIRYGGKVDVFTGTHDGPPLVLTGSGNQTYFGSSLAGLP